MLPLLLLLLAADEPPVTDAVAALRKHCAPCHGDKPRYGGFNVLDRKALFDKKLLIAGSAERSELWLAVAAGSMPPVGHERMSDVERDALRRWILDGAPVERTVTLTGESYILSEIARDWNAHRSPSARYVSLDHLLLTRGGPTRLAAARAELQRVLTAFTAAGKPAPKIVPIDRQQSLFRVDLDALGWDARPFKDGSLNLWDLVLLEYPYGVVPLTDPAFAAALPVLRGTKPIRPLLHVRGDWLIGVLTDGRKREPRLADDVRAALGITAEKPKPPPDDVWDWQVTLEEAVREIGKTVPAEAFDAALKEAGVTDLLENGDIRRDRWDAVFPSVARALKLGEPVLPLDALDTVVLAEGPFKLHVSPQDDRTLMDAVSFAPGGRLTVQVRPDEDAVCEVVVRYREVARSAIWQPVTAVRGRVGLRPPKAWDVGRVEGDIEVVVYWTDRAGKLPPGTLLEAAGGKRVRPRVLHPHYQMNADGRSFAGLPPARVGRQTTTVNVASP